MPPNILFITTDQHRFDFFDNKYVDSLQVPNMMRLQREGTTCTHANSNCPVCMPTRFTWLHGLYASQAHGALLANAHDWPPPERFPTMAQALQKAGYRTALIGKLHSHCGTGMLSRTRNTGPGRAVLMTSWRYAEKASRTGTTAPGRVILRSAAS